MTSRRQARIHPTRRRRRRLVAALLAALAVAAVVAAAMAVEARTLRTNAVTYTDAELPASFDGLRVAFVADIHAGPFFSRRRVAELVARINSLHPDLVVLGGDYAYRDTTAVPSAFAELSGLEAPLGVYAVSGNHDHWLGIAATRAGMAAAGIYDLDNDGVWLRRGGSRLRLCGVDDLWEGDQDLPRALGNATADDFVLLVSHNPDFAEELHGADVDLVLSGHTHGGQVTFFGWAPFLPSDYGQKYRAGAARRGETTVLVTTGVGTTGVPLRAFARPEIVLLTLRAR